MSWLFVHLLLLSGGIEKSLTLREPAHASEGQADRCRLGERETQVHGNAEGAADTTVLGRFAQAGELRAVEHALEDQLRLDADDAALGFRGSEPGFKPPDRPLSAFGEPPNIRELSGADGAE